VSVKSSIGWCDITCNPILGLCQGNCRLPDGRAYCYYSGKRGIAKRFEQDPTLRLDLSVFDKLPKKPKRVFLCSTNDYWGDWIPDEWREAIRVKTQEYPQHTFLLLTKQPQNLFIGSPYPENWWVGVTATDFKAFAYATLYLGQIEAKIKFISFEPLLERIATDKKGGYGAEFLSSDIKHFVNWVIIGRLTGYGTKYDPKIEWVKEIVRACDKAGAKVFLKDNLKSLLENDHRTFMNPLYWKKGYYTSPEHPNIDLQLRQEIPE